MNTDFPLDVSPSAIWRLLLALLICTFSACAIGDSGGDEEDGSADSGDVTGVREVPGVVSGTATPTPRVSPTATGPVISTTATPRPSATASATPRSGTATPTPSGVPQSFTQTGTSNAGGQIQFAFGLQDGRTKLGVIAQSSGNNLSIDSLFSSSGSQFIREGNTQAQESLPAVKAANAPSRDADPALQNDDDYTVAITTSGGNSGVDLTVLSASDSDFSRGTVSLNVYHVGAASQTGAARAAISSALTQLSSLYSAQAGITLDIQELDIAGPDSLPDPAGGAALYQSGTQVGTSPAVNLFVAAEVQSGASNAPLAVADIPTSPLPSIRSAACVSLNSAAGSSGTFTSDEITVLAQRFAKAIGGYMGLFDIVELGTSTVLADDPLSDTASCTTVTECVGKAAVVSNIMFATPVAGVDDDLVIGKQNKFTAQQKAVLNRYIAVDF